MSKGILTPSREDMLKAIRENPEIFLEHFHSQRELLEQLYELSLREQHAEVAAIIRNQIGSIATTIIRKRVMKGGAK